MKKKMASLLIFILITSCTSEEAIPTAEENIDVTSTITSTSTSTSTTLLEESVFAVDEYGIELIEMKPQMKEQFDASNCFCRKTNRINLYRISKV